MQLLLSQQLDTAGMRLALEKERPRGKSWARATVGPPPRSAGEWASRGTRSGPWGRKRRLAAAPWVSLML